MSNKNPKIENLSKKVLTSPVHFLAFGFGSGLAPFAPGTFGTLAAIPLFLLMQPLSLPIYLLITAVVCLVGIWICGKSSEMLGVHDHYRMGGIRFKKDPKGDFLDNNYQYAAPPINSLRELEHAVIQVEKGGTSSDLDYLKWLNLLISPGSSLGGARPKASVVDTDNSLWIAKFPSQYDDHDIGAWEFVTYQLAVAAGIEMSECRIQRFNSPSTTP